MPLKTKFSFLFEQLIQPCVAHILTGCGSLSKSLNLGYGPKHPDSPLLWLLNNLPPFFSRGVGVRAYLPV